MAHIETEVDGRVATVTMNRAPLNCLTPDVMNELIDALTKVKEQPYATRPRAVLLESAVDSMFCAGMDPEYILQADLSERRRVFVVLADMMECFYKLGIPVVADVSGPALAGGAVLALLADFAIIDRDKGKICFSEAKVGLPVPAMVQSLIQSKCSPQFALELSLLGKNISADRAVSIGLASEAYDSSDQRRIMLEDILGRITRIDAHVLAATLQDAKADLLDDKEAFLSTMDDSFCKFLSNDFIGKGLKGLVEGKKVTW